MGQPDGIAAIELPIEPSRRDFSTENTSRYIDVSGENFRDLSEEEFCLRAISTAAHEHLTGIPRSDETYSAVQSFEDARSKELSQKDDQYIARRLEEIQQQVGQTLI